MTLIGTYPEEAALAHLAPGLRRCIHLLGQLDSLGGHTVAAWGVERVLGGDRTPQAERRAELLEALAGMPPKLVKIAEKLRSYRSDSARGRYIAGLLRGQSGSDLQQAAKLSCGAMEENRRWLRSIVGSHVRK